MGTSFQVFPDLSSPSDSPVFTVSAPILRIRRKRLDNRPSGRQSKRLLNRILRPQIALRSATGRPVGLSIISGLDFRRLWHSEKRKTKWFPRLKKRQSCRIFENAFTRRTCYG
jgi:hypothetical protein